MSTIHRTIYLCPMRTSSAYRANPFGRRRPEGAVLERPPVPAYKLDMSPRGNSVLDAFMPTDQWLAIRNGRIVASGSSFGEVAQPSDKVLLTPASSLPPPRALAPFARGGGKSKK